MSFDNQYLTWSLTWGDYNYAQKLSGKTFTDPDGHVVNCQSVTVTFSSSVNFHKFYATAVKSGKNYGFISDVLVDIEGSTPTGVKLHELTDRTANTSFNFTINASSLLEGDGIYRIGLYVQDINGFWNYEYFFIPVGDDYFEDSDGLLLTVPVQTTIS